eukprot:297325-Chlamydomonas_euryale.AAC.2
MRVREEGSEGGRVEGTEEEGERTGAGEDGDDSSSSCMWVRAHAATQLTQQRTTLVPTQSHCHGHRHCRCCCHTRISTAQTVAVTITVTVTAIATVTVAVTVTDCDCYHNGNAPCHNHSSNQSNPTIPTNACARGLDPLPCACLD